MDQASKDMMDQIAEEDSGPGMTVKNADNFGRGWVYRLMWAAYRRGHRDGRAVGDSWETD